MLDISSNFGTLWVPNDIDYINEVFDILNEEDVQSMNQYMQHGNTTCFSHSVAASYNSYRTCKKKGLDARSAARGGLLHDLFLYDWHRYTKPKKSLPHGFTHPLTSYKNASKLFNLNIKEKEIILKHMWPLTIIPPVFKETFVVIYHDKMVTLKEFSKINHKNQQLGLLKAKNL